MIQCIKKLQNIPVALEVVELEDLLKQNGPFKTNYRGTFDEIFGKLIYSYKRFHLYIYQLYPREKRSYYLAKWIVDNFIQLLIEDLIEENDTFVFPRGKAKLMVLDANTRRQTCDKFYHIRTYGKEWRLFVEKRGQAMFARIAHKYWSRIVKNGINNKYL